MDEDREEKALGGVRDRYTQIRGEGERTMISLRRKMDLKKEGIEPGVWR